MAGKIAVFLDPTGRRARLTNVILVACCVIIVSSFSLLLLSLSRTPALPSLTAPATSPVTPTEHDTVRRTLAYGTPRDRSLKPQNKSALRAAYLDSFAGSLNSFKLHAGELDLLFTDWFRVQDDGRLLESEREDHALLRSWIDRNAGHLSVYPSVEFRPRRNQPLRALADPSKRAGIIKDLMKIAADRHLSGFMLPASQISQSSLSHYAAFLNALASSLHHERMKLIIQFDAGDLDDSVIKFADLADLAVINLSQGPGTMKGLAPAPQPWFEAMLSKALSRIRSDKIIITVGSYAHDFADSGLAQVLSIQQAWDQVPIPSAFTFDPASLNGTFSYLDASGTTHRVWMLDGASVFNQVRAALAAKPAGIALWRLGSEDTSVWDIISRDKLPDATALAAMRRHQPGSNPIGIGKGAVFSVSNNRIDGERDISYDATRGLILDQRVKQKPSGAVLHNWGLQNADKIALTFDDGPDRLYTPQVLDLLKEKQVPAAFFIVGRNGLRNPDLLRRMYDEGHEIGNHTYTHSSLRDRPPNDITFEVNATQRVIESAAGVRTVLFRAPYADVGVDGDIKGLAALEQVSKAGYLSVRVTLDPRDWANPTPQQIVDRIFLELGNNKTENGQIILLHDAGGPRRSTLAALPVLIDALRARGFKFVTIAELMGKTRSEVMPPSLEKNYGARALARTASFGLGSAAWMSKVLPAVGIIAAAFGLLRITVIVVLAVRHKSTVLHRARLNWRPDSLTVLVPAYNEEKVICKTIRSLLASRHRKFDIVVVDDGSSDGTADAVRREFWRTKRVRIFKKANSGKSAALNFGLDKTASEIIVALDADTVFDPRAIEKLIRHFQDPGVGAVAGRAVVGNKRSLMACFQSLEYVTSQNLDRRAFEWFNAIGVVPGAIGAWRRKALVEAGGYPNDTLAEDADVTIALERAGWRVLYEPDAIARTEAPETVRAFLKQRFRWMYGTLQVAFKHRSAFLQKSARGVGLITLPNIVVFQFLFTLLAPLMDFMLAVVLLNTAREWMIAPDAILYEDARLIMVCWFVFQTADTVMAAIGLALDGDGKDWHLLPLIFIQRFCYRQLLYFVAVRTVLAALRGHFVGWGKLLRTGTVREGHMVPAGMT